MLSFHIFSGEGLWRGLSPPQMIVVKLNLKEMHFKNVDHWVHALYKKILNLFTLLMDCTSLLHHFYSLFAICLLWPIVSLLIVKN